MPLERQAEAEKPGRPRDDDARRDILRAALALTEELGFRSVSIDRIAARAGVGKATIYRWWPNKAHVIMTAFFEEFGPGLSIRPGASAMGSVRAQLRALIKSLNGRQGTVIRNLIAEAQTDPDLSEAFAANWTRPRRAAVRAILQQGVESGELSCSLDLETVMDALYAPVYQRLMMSPSEPIQTSYADQICDLVLHGCKP